MSTAPATVRANIGWFASRYLLAVLVLIAASVGLSMAGIQLPSGLSIGLNAGLFLAIVNFAGTRFANGSGDAWTRENRGRLAFGYVVAAMIVSLVLTIVALTAIAALAPALVTMLQQEAGSLNLSTFAIIMAVVILLVAGMYYIGARFVLGRIEPSSSG